MIWLQTCAFLILAGFNKETLGDILASHSNNDHGKNKPPVSYARSTFPYYHLGPEKSDLYTSSIASFSAGPLCSGFHINPRVVVTAASCVYREDNSDLFVISHLKTNALGLKLAFLPVISKNLHPQYDLRTDEHNIAVLIVMNATHIPFLNLPPLGSPIHNLLSDLFIVKFSYDKELIKFFTTAFPAEANLNTKKCTDRTPTSNSFLCVSRSDNLELSYGLTDLGTPLVFSTPNGDFVNGIFTGHRYNQPRSHYLYQNIYANLVFLYNFIPK